MKHPAQFDIQRDRLAAQVSSIRSVARDAEGFAPHCPGRYPGKFSPGPGEPMAAILALIFYSLSSWALLMERQSRHLTPAAQPETPKTTPLYQSSIDSSVLKGIQWERSQWERSQPGNRLSSAAQKNEPGKNLETCQIAGERWIIKTALGPGQIIMPELSRN
jgi:hypothetical protein